MFGRNKFDLLKSVYDERIERLEADLRAAEERERDRKAHESWERSLREEMERDVAKLREDKQALEVKNAVLMERLDLVANYGLSPSTASSGLPSHFTVGRTPTLATPVRGDPPKP